MIADIASGSSHSVFVGVGKHSVKNSTRPRFTSRPHWLRAHPDTSWPASSRRSSPQLCYRRSCLYIALCDLGWLRLNFSPTFHDLFIMSRRMPLHSRRSRVMLSLTACVTIASLVYRSQTFPLASEVVKKLTPIVKQPLTNAQEFPGS